jgi:hypothetical protein
MPYATGTPMMFMPNVAVAPVMFMPYATGTNMVMPYATGTNMVTPYATGTNVMPRAARKGRPKAKAKAGGKAKANAAGKGRPRANAAGKSSGKLTIRLRMPKKKAVDCAESTESIAMAPPPARMNSVHREFPISKKCRKNLDLYEKFITKNNGDSCIATTHRTEEGFHLGIQAKEFKKFCNGELTEFTSLKMEAFQRIAADFVVPPDTDFTSLKFEALRRIGALPRESESHIEGQSQGRVAPGRSFLEASMQI